MAKKPGFRPYLILCTLFLITGALLLFTVDVRISDVAGIRQKLPPTLSNTWVGLNPLFCQDPTCNRVWMKEDLSPDEDGVYTCPTNRSGRPCGAELRGASLAEIENLPGDTTIFKKRYVNLEDRTEEVSATVVLSGKDRSSIHRPEVCMPSQGNTIINREVIDVTFPDRDPLQIMVLNMTLPRENSPDINTYYAYWFVGNNRETPHHWERMMWMSTDRIFHNVSHRWAYVALYGQRNHDLANKDHYDQIREVVRDLYPQMSLIQESK